MQKHMIRANMAAGARLDELEGQECWVFPLIMLREGVHSGSGGPILYRESDLAKCPKAWDAKPVVIRHPLEGGSPVSGSTPKTFNTTKVGTLFNTKWENGRLKAEAWCPKEQLKDRAPEVLREIEAGEILEISTGLFFDVLEEMGEWNGEQYDCVAVNYQPDHLAILPDETGAFSVQDGGGIPRLNKKQTNDPRLMFLSQMISNEQSFAEITNRVQTLIRDEVRELFVGDFLDVWIEEMYQNRFVYSRSDRSGKYYQRGFTVIEPVTVTLAPQSEEVEVARNIEFVTLAQKQVDKENEMGVEETKVIETIRGELNALTETVSNMKQETPVVNAEHVPELKPAPDLTTYVNQAPDEIRDELTEMIVERNARMDALIQKLTANKDFPYTVEDLKGKSQADLEKLMTLSAMAKGEKPQPDFSVQGMTPASTPPIEPMVLPE